MRIYAIMLLSRGFSVTHYHAYYQNRYYKSRGTLQNKVRINVVPAQWFTFSMICSHIFGIRKINTFFKRCLLYCSDNCSEMNALSHFRNEKNGISYKWIKLQFNSLW